METKTLKEWIDFLAVYGKKIKIKSENGIDPQKSFFAEDAKKEYADWLNWPVINIYFNTWPTNPHVLIIKNPDEII